MNECQMKYFVLVSNEQLKGVNLNEQAQIVQWIQYSDRDILPVCMTLSYPAMSIMSVNRNQADQANKQLKAILKLLDEHLRHRTYLVGERVSLADISVACDMLLLFQLVRSFVDILTEMKRNRKIDSYLGH